MVLQRESEVKIWGWAQPGEKAFIYCDWLDVVYEVPTDSRGEWQVIVQTSKAGGPHKINITGSVSKNRIELTDILFGEVWIASGQSNMEMPVGHFSGTYSGVQDFKQEIAAAKHPEIRLFQVGNFSSKEPLDDVETGISMYGIPVADCRWKACSPETIPAFASTAYFFARKLHEELGVPIGIVDASWGGTKIESWMPAAGLQKHGRDALLKHAATAPQDPAQKVPTRLYNGMIHPLRQMKIRGFIWYQGEQNAAEADQYAPLFATMIDQWRSSFGHDYPFYFAQAAPCSRYQVNAALLREAQLKCMARGGKDGVPKTGMPKTGMAVTLDIGDLDDVHPKNKQEIGRRLALWALAKDYGRPIVPSGPVYREAKFENGRARLAFDFATGGLATSDNNSPSHFEIAGEDQVFYPAKAVIDGKRLLVTSEKVAKPVAVRYSFTSAGGGNLINKQGLPASSFRTDAWKIPLEP